MSSSFPLLIGRDSLKWDNDEVLWVDSGELGFFNALQPRAGPVDMRGVSGDGAYFDQAPTWD